MLFQNLHQLWVFRIELFAQIVDFVVIELKILAIVQNFVEYVFDVFFSNRLRSLANDVIGKLSQSLSHLESIKLVGLNEHLKQVQVLIVHFPSLLSQYLLLLIAEMLVHEKLEGLLGFVNQIRQQGCLILALIASILTVAGLEETEMLFENGYYLLVLFVDQIEQHGILVESKFLGQVFVLDDGHKVIDRL